MPLALLTGSVREASAQGSPAWIWPAGGHAGIAYPRLTPDGQTLVSGATYDETTKVWRASDGRLLRTMAHNYGQVTGLSIAIDRSDAMMLVGVIGRPVRGHLTAGEAFAALTARTGVQYRRDNVTVTPAAEYIRHVGSGGNRGPCTHPAAGGLPSVRGQLPGSRRVAGRRLLLALRRGAAARPGHAPAGRAPERR